MKISIFRRVFPPHPDMGRTVETTWENFVRMFSPPWQEITDPHDRPAFGMYSLTGPRCDANVEAFSGLALDFDGLTLPQLSTILAKAARFRTLIYSTYSAHNPAKAIAIRVVVPFEFHKDAWEREYQRLETYLGATADERAEKLSQVSFIPCIRPEDRGKPTLFVVNNGRPYNPAYLPGSRIIGLQDWKELRAALVRKQTHNAKVGDALNAARRIIAGEPFADPRARDSSLVSLIGHMKDVWGTDLDLESVVKTMLPSIALMTEEFADPAWILEKLERFFAKAREEQLSSLEERIRQHFAYQGIDRADAYTKEEIEYMVKKYAGGASHPYLLHIGKRIYSLTLSGYRSIGDRDMPDVKTALVPFPNIEFRRPDGTIRGTPSLLDDYGQEVSELQHAYGSDSSFTGGTLVLPAAPLRALEPRLDPRVDAWLDALAGPEAGALRTWLAWLPYTNQGLICLYLVGAPSAGKSLLIRAASRLWSDTHGWTDMRECFADFNQDMIHSPLAWADESFPTNKQGYALTDEFKELVQSPTHKLRIKYSPASKLSGYVRTVLTANHSNMLRATNRTADDIMALTRRIRRIYVPQAAAQFLSAMPFGGEPLDQTDIVARHILALPRPPKEDEQFVLKGSPDLADDLVLHTQLGDYLLSQASQVRMMGNDQDARGWRIRQGEIYANPEKILQGWPGAKAPLMRNLLETLAMLSDMHPRTFVGEKSFFYRIRPEMLDKYSAN